MTEIAVVVIIAALIQKIVERIRETVPLDGGWVNLAATALGFLFAFGCGFGVLGALVQSDMVHVPWWLDQAITGFGLGAGAGFFADLAGRNDSSTPDTVCRYPGGCLYPEREEG